MQIEVKRVSREHVLAKVILNDRVRAGLYANEEGEDEPITEARVRTDWRENRSAFQKYDEVNGCFL